MYLLLCSYKTSCIMWCWQDFITITIWTRRLSLIILHVAFLCLTLIHLDKYQQQLSVKIILSFWFNNVIVIPASSLSFVGCHDDCCCVHPGAVFIPYSVQKETQTGRHWWWINQSILPYIDNLLVTKWQHLKMSVLCFVTSQSCRLMSVR